MYTNLCVCVMPGNFQSHAFSSDCMYSIDCALNKKDVRSGIFMTGCIKDEVVPHNATFSYSNIEMTYYVCGS